MARKRIADLLNEEVEKLNADDATSDDVNTEENTVIKSTRTTPARRSPTRTRQTTQNNNNELEGVVSELQATLEQVRKSETLLQQQVVDLQQALEAQKSLTQQFQQKLESTESLKAELEQAKKTIVQLAEANSQLIEEYNPPKKEPEPAKPIQSIQPVKSRQEYKSARQTVIFPDQEQQTKEGEYKDFAKSSWLL